MPAAVIPKSAVAADDNEIAMVATVTPVPEPYCKQVLNGYYAWNINIRDIIPLFYFAGGIGLIAIGAWLGTKEQIVLCALLVSIGIAGFIWGTYTSQLCLCVYGTRWAGARLRAEFAKRPKVIVDLNDPELQFVSIMPREAFAKIRWTMSSDLLLMKIDNQRKEVRLEGDVDQYVIPVAAISDCQPVCMFPSDRRATTKPALDGTAPYSARRRRAGIAHRRRPYRFLATNQQEAGKNRARDLRENQRTVADHRVKYS